MKGNNTGASTPESLSTRLNRLSEIAKAQPGYQFKTLAHWIEPGLLRTSFHELRADAAAGVDGVTAKEYAGNLEENLKDLHERMRAGRYQAQPLRRVYIDKEDGAKRPLSIPALEDKIVQRAMVKILEPIYEVDFRDSSYGYRPNRNPHTAINQLSMDMVYKRLNWVIDADIKDYFGSIVRMHLMEFVAKRIADKNLLRLIGKWLHVGVIEDGRLLTAETGTYQGSVISPILANIYLHEVLDLWFEQEVRPRLKGEATLYRFADDFVMAFELREDAERVMAVLGKRFEKYGLKLHPEKTHLLEFGRQAWERWRNRKGPRPKGFTFLGFTHYCGTTRKGKFSMKSKTAGKRFRRALKRIQLWCKRWKHLPLTKQRERLNRMLIGHYNFYGRLGNAESLKKLHYRVIFIWWRSLNRRSRRGQHMNFETFEKKVLRRHRLASPRLNPTLTNWQLKFSL